MFEAMELAFRFRYFKNLGNTIIDFFSQVKGLFVTFGYIDAVDILFVAVVLYLIIRIVRETRAMQLIRGLIILAALYGLVTFLGMGASSYIMKAIFSNILIIIVILFGPEIRSILERFGTGAASSSIMSMLRSGVALDINEMNKVIDATCKACADMSDARTGALIVFENQTLLGDIISTGTHLDASASKELIENVFYPKSPLHDGAVIIRGTKIYAAGCILPLTKNNDISSALGTRHRAALGISEQSDAIVFVVSEETGGISCAMNGSLQKNISSGDMRDILVSNFIPNGDASDGKMVSKLRRRMKNNGK